MSFLGAGTRQERTGVGPGPEGDEGDLGRLTSRVMTLTGRGELKALDAELGPWRQSTADGRSPPWRLALWSGMQALLQGRLDTCDRWAHTAAERGRSRGDDEAEAGAGVLLVLLRREQERPAEAEVILREMLDRFPTLLSPRVARASLLGDLGRDSEARRQLRALAVDDFAEVREDPGWLAAMCQLASLAVLVDREGDAAALYRHLSPYAWRFAVEPQGAACHGSVSLYLGVLAHGLGRWDDAESHFQDALDAHRQAGTPILVAHTQRRYAALLRARGCDDDWEAAVERLSEAEAIYGRLGIDERAAEAQSVLARSQDPVVWETATVNEWRLDGVTCVVRFAGREARLADSKGLRDLACLVANPGHSYHVADLWGQTGRSVGRAGANGRGLGRRPGGLAPPIVKPPAPTLDGPTRDECQARLEELREELDDAGRRGDATAAALARAEREVLAEELAGNCSDDDPTAQVRRLVTFGLRRAVDRIAEAHPDLGRHLRYSVRTGTFCAYHPPAGTTWES